MVFQPTENRTPSATATTGEPTRAKMSTPWCQPTSARAAPHVSLNEAYASTGNTYGAPSSVGVPLSRGAVVPLSSPTAPLPLEAFGAVATGGAGRRAVVVGADGCGAWRGAVVATGDGAVVSAGAVVGSWGSVSTVVTVSVVVVAVVSHSPGVSAVVIVTAGSGLSQGGGTPAGAGAANDPAAAAITDAASAAATDLAAGPMRGGSTGGKDTKCGRAAARAAVRRVPAQSVATRTAC